MHSKSPRPPESAHGTHNHTLTCNPEDTTVYGVNAPRSELTHVPHPSFHESQMHMHSLLGSLFRSNSLTHNSSLRTRVLRASPSCAVSTLANQNGAGMPMAVRRVRGRARHSSQFTVVLLEPTRGRRPLATALEPSALCPKWPRAGSRVFATQSLREPPGLLDEHLSHAVPIE